MALTGPRTALALLGLWAVLAIPAASAADRPNILLVLLDDFGVNDLAAGPTPRLKDIASRGISFSRHYAESVCAPGRASLLTGRPAASVGFHTYREGISPEFQTLPRQLQAAGYRTFFLGKWHLGRAFESARPRAQGFDHWFGMFEAVDTVDDQPDKGPLRISYLDPWLESESSRKQYPGHLTDLLGQRAGEFMRKTTDQPWFIQLAFLAPHQPVTPAPRFAKQYRDTPRGRYLALLQQVDEIIGKLVDAVPDDTIVVITSDNGGTGRAFESNLPFDGNKGFFQEGGLRTPLLLHWPGRWQGGERLDHAVSIMDIAPTLLRAIDVKPAASMRGRDLFERAPRPLFWYQQTPRLEQASVLSDSGDWRLITSNWGDPLLLPLGDSRVRDASAEKRAAVKRDLSSQLSRWVEGVTRVQLEGEPGENDSWHYRGDRFRRSPTLGSWSMALALEAGGSRDGVFAQQAGYLSLAATGADKLALAFDGHSAEIGLPKLGPGCHSLALAAYLVKSRGRTDFRRPDSRLLVYLDGEEIYRATYRNRSYSTSPPSTPLVLSGGKDQRVRALGGDRLHLSTRELSPAQVASIHKELVADCEFRTAGF